MNPQPSPFETFWINTWEKILDGFGIDLAIGAVVDVKATPWNRLFIRITFPLYWPVLIKDGGH